MHTIVLAFLIVASQATDEGFYRSEIVEVGPNCDQSLLGKTRTWFHVDYEPEVMVAIPSASGKTVGWVKPIFENGKVHPQKPVNSTCLTQARLNSNGTVTTTHRGCQFACRSVTVRSRFLAPASAGFRQNFSAMQCTSNGKHPLEIVWDGRYAPRAKWIDEARGRRYDTNILLPWPLTTTGVFGVNVSYFGYELHRGECAGGGNLVGDAVFKDGRTLELCCTAKVKR